MAQKYRKIDPRIWRDEKFAELSESEKLIAIYCLTAQVNRCGIFVFSPAMAAEELGTSTQTFRERFGRVVSTLNWRWDSERRVLYFPRWWRYNQPENSNVMKGALSDLIELPQTPLLAEFYANVQHLDSNVTETFRERSRNVSQTIGNSGTGTETGTGDKKAPQETAGSKPLVSVPFPEQLDTPEFRHEWERWKADRKARKIRKYTVDGEETALKKLARDSAGSVAAAIDIIHTSIANSWQGLFPPKSTGRGFQTHDDRVGDVMFGGPGNG